MRKVSLFLLSALVSTSIFASPTSVATSVAKVNGKVNHRADAPSLYAFHIHNETGATQSYTWRMMACVVQGQSVCPEHKTGNVILQPNQETSFNDQLVIHSSCGGQPSAVGLSSESYVRNNTTGQEWVKQATNVAICDY